VHVDERVLRGATKSAQIFGTGTPVKRTHGMGVNQSWARTGRGGYLTAKTIKCTEGEFEDGQGMRCVYEYIFHIINQATSHPHQLSHLLDLTSAIENKFVED
jgi:hypothetical protein